MEPNFRQMNYESMANTLDLCETRYLYAVQNSIKKQQIILSEDNVSCEVQVNPKQKIIVSNKKTFEAAKEYKGKKVAVLNFANAHSPGGAPFYANAQEEVLCRCSTLYPCLLNAKEQFYDKHIQDFKSGAINWQGTDDIIYTPEVLVFKDDTNNEGPLPTEFYVDVITCAAPEYFASVAPEKFMQDLFDKRAQRIIDVAIQNKVEVLILGAFGCGAFGNSPEVVAKAFNKATKGKTPFDIIEYAVYVRKPIECDNFDIFKKVINNS